MLDLASRFGPDPAHRAIIFDCDGTLADTMPAHYEAWFDTLRAHSLEMSEDRFYALGGWPTKSVLELLAREAGRVLDLDQVAGEKEAQFERMLGGILPIEPVAQIARAAQGRLPIAVATGAVRSICLRILKQIGMAETFDAVVCADDVTRHKPDPEIFLVAAAQLGVPPADCLVYEDSDPGIEAARRAGMSCRDVRDFYRPRRVTAG